MRIATQEEADALSVDAGPDMTFSDCFTNSVEINATVFPLDGNYVFEWSTQNGNINFGSDESRIFVDEPGIYEILLTDETTGCTTFDEVEVFPAADMLFLDVQTTDVSCFGEGDGDVDLEITGGTPPFTVVSTSMDVITLSLIHI